MKNILRIALIALFAFQLKAQTLDGGFSTGTGFNSIIYTFAQQQDGKILVGGGFTSYNGTAMGRLARLTDNGTLDVLFTTTTDNTVTSIKVLQDQRILVCGAFNTVNGQGRSKLVCLLADGTIDTSFHYGSGFSGGTSPSYYNVQSIEQQSDGKILVAGEFTQYDATGAGHIIRLNTDGTIDSSFNSTAGANSYGIYKVMCQPDGKILAAGSFTTYNNVAAGNIVRLNPDGTIDNTFSNSPGANLLIRSMALQPDGKVVCGGAFTTYNGVTQPRLVRLEANGQIDSTFIIGTGPSGAVNSLIIHPGGKILVGSGSTTYNGIASRRLAVLNTDGTLDATFPIGTGFTGSGSVSALYCYADGKVLAGGLFNGFDGTTAGNIVRLNNNNPLPVTLTHFVATPKETAILLTWTTASEQNNEGFAIERSNGNNKWEEIGFVKGSGNSNTTRKYAFTDFSPFTFDLSPQYYRLKQADYNGTYTYSDIVSVSVKSSGEVSFGPNPFTNEIHLSSPSDIVLYDVNGMEVLKGYNVVSLPTAHLPSGLYTVKITSGAQPVFHKLIK
jgi:uncharacterized delta-60 repeat protein